MASLYLGFTKMHFFLVKFLIKCCFLPEEQKIIRKFEPTKNLIVAAATQPVNTCPIFFLPQYNPLQTGPREGIFLALCLPGGQQ